LRFRKHSRFSIDNDIDSRKKKNVSATPSEEEREREESAAFFTAEWVGACLHEALNNIETQSLAPLLVLAFIIDKLIYRCSYFLKIAYLEPTTNTFSHRSGVTVERRTKIDVFERTN